MQRHDTVKPIISMVIWSLLLGMILACNSSNEANIAQFQKIQYNQPELEVDLGVGLWAWPLPMDYDEDGDNDLVVACPDVPSNGMFFFENLSNSKTTRPIFARSVRIADGDKNHQVSYVDGQPRVLQQGTEFLNFINTQLAQTDEIYPARRLERLHEKIRFSQWKYVDYEADGDLDLLVGMDDWGEYGWDNAFDKRGRWTNGPLHGYVYLIENREGKYYEGEQLLAGGKPIDVFGAPSPNMEDFDGDGDLDLICGEFVDKLTWFENIGSRTRPQFKEGRFLANESGIIKLDLQMIIPSAIDWDDDGDIDLVVGDEDGRVAILEHRGLQRDGTPLFSNPHYVQQRADDLKFGALVTPYSVDWDDDGDQDLICGNTAGQIGFIENLDGGDPPKWGAPELLEVDGKPFRIMAGDSGSIQGPAEQKWGYTTLCVADWDGDGLKDIIFNSIWGRIEWIKNIGVKGSPQLTPASPVRVDWSDPEQIPKPKWNWWDPDTSELVVQWRTSPQAIDWNRDGMMDLVSLDHQGYLTFYERFQQDGELLLKPGASIFYGEGGSEFDRHNVVDLKKEGPLRLNNGEAGKSGRRKWCFVDWDQDGDLDILINSQNIALFEQVSSKEGRVSFRFRGDLTDQKLAGHTTSPTIVDWDQNGVPDLLVGAEDGCFYHLQNLN